MLVRTQGGDSIPKCQALFATDMARHFRQTASFEQTKSMTYLTESLKL